MFPHVSDYVLHLGSNNLKGLSDGGQRYSNNASGNGVATSNAAANGAAATNASANGIPVSAVPLVPPPYAKSFPDISKVEFGGQNFKRWQERIYSILDMYGVVFALKQPKPETDDSKQLDSWSYTNKVCRHTIINTLSNELFDVCCSYKEAKDIWESMTLKYTAEDAGKQKFVIGNFYHWEMDDDKDITG